MRTPSSTWPPARHRSIRWPITPGGDLAFWVFGFQDAEKPAAVVGRRQSTGVNDQIVWRIAFARGDRLAEDGWQFVDCELERFVPGPHRNELGEKTGPNLITPIINFSNNFLYVTYNNLELEQNSGSDWWSPAACCWSGLASTTCWRRRPAVGSRRSIIIT